MDPGSAPPEIFEVRISAGHALQILDVGAARLGIVMQALKLRQVPLLTNSTSAGRVALPCRRVLNRLTNPDHSPSALTGGSKASTTSRGVGGRFHRVEHPRGRGRLAGFQELGPPELHEWNVPAGELAFGGPRCSRRGHGASSWFGLQRANVPESACELF